MLGLYCLSSGIVMNELINEGARSIILASGTLAPHDSFEAEMKISFPLKLENGHVIKNHQILFRSIHKGPSNVILNSKFSNKDNKAYLNEIGECLCTFAEHSEGGLLAFFPSYSLLDSCIKNWNSSTGLIKQISSFKKVFVEASDKYKFDSEIKGYSDQIRRDPVRGAIFLAVCRGKASEGVDFSGDLGRTVLIFGIPYASPKDSKVELKRLYLTENIKYGFDGNKWYNQQASRAVNQAIGRVIRHKDDYGSIFLMDERFNDSYKRFLPSWTRKYFEASSIYEIPQLLSNFYNKAKELLPIAPKEVIYNKKVVKVSKIVSKIDMSSSTTFSTVSTGMSSSTTMNSIPSLTTMERLNQIKLPPVAYMSPTKVRTKRDAFSPLVVKTVKKQVQKTTLNYTNSMKILVGDVSVIDKNSVFLDKVIMIFNDQQKNTFERIIFKHRRLFKEEFFTIFRKLFCGGEERIVKLKLDHLSHSNGTYEFIEELVLMMGLRGDTRPIWREMFFSLRKFLKAVERSEFEAYVSSSDQAFFCKFFKPDP